MCMCERESERAAHKCVILGIVYVSFLVGQSNLEGLAIWIEHDWAHADRLFDFILPYIFPCGILDHARWMSKTCEIMAENNW